MFSHGDLGREDRSVSMTCKKFVEDFLADYLAETLNPQQGQEIESHLASCPSCAALLNTYRMTIDLCREKRQAEPSRHLKERVFDRLREKVGNALFLEPVSVEASEWPASSFPGK